LRKGTYKLYNRWAEQQEFRFFRKGTYIL
jgi:hypothetical protein